MSESTVTDVDRAVAAVSNDLAVRRVVEHLWRTHSTTMDEAEGAYVRGEEDALQWVAIDAYHAVEWARDPSLAGVKGRVVAITLAFYDTGLHGPDIDDTGLDADIRAVLDAIETCDA